ncbi:MAG: hypothetical protein CML46_17870 [Rhodobacteraceae bacterium]|nr:hypothetical protein [Paracoccaceae bacterium]MBR28784.1 hypothetical protein [Paracoccaceae bacterium]
MIPFARRLAASLALLLAILAGGASAQVPGPRPGWRVIETALPYADLLPRLREAARAENMGLVTEAGPTEAAAGRGVTIPGNRVVGVFRNDYAVRALGLSVAAMIEAPIRFYVTENGNGTGAALSWKTPGAVFAPYADEGGAELEALAAELDAVFEAIAARATAE